MSLTNEKIDWDAIENSSLDPLYEKILDYGSTSLPITKNGSGCSPYISLCINDIDTPGYSSIHGEYGHTNSIDIIYNSVMSFYNARTAFLCIYDQKLVISKLIFIVKILQDLHDQDSGQLIYCCDNAQKRLKFEILLYKLGIPFGLTKIKKYGKEERVFISNSNLCKNNKRMVVVTNTDHLPHIMRSPVLRHLSILCLDGTITSHNYTRLDVRYPKYVISLPNSNDALSLPLQGLVCDLHARLESKICKYCMKVKVILHNCGSIDIYDLCFQSNMDKSLPPKETSLSELNKYFHNNR